MIRQLVTLLTLALVALPAAAQSTRTTTFVYTDHLGSPIMLVEAGTRNVVWQAQYGPFGEVVAESGTPADRPGYTGHYRDVPTGLVYMQQRYYDPAAGRFLSVDPVTPSLEDGSNFNRYWYANNNPYTFVDPDGEFALPAAMIVGAVAGGGLEFIRQREAGGGFDMRKIGAQAGKGAAVGGMTVIGGGGVAAMARLAGATSKVATGGARATGASAGAGLGTIISSPFADIAGGGEIRPGIEILSEAAASAPGALVGTYATAAAVGAGASPALASGIGAAAGEVVSATANEAIKPHDTLKDRLPE